MRATSPIWFRLCAKRGYQASSVLLYGPDPAGQLVDHLRRIPVDLLVVGSHGHGLVRDILFGQTVDRVRHNLEIPMLIARPGRGPVNQASTSHLLDSNQSYEALDASEVES